MEEQLYHTIASTLKPLQTANHISGNSETTEDLRRLCVIFEHVEKLLTLAVSLHRKFMQAPCLSEAIFTDYHNFYLPRMGTGSTGLLDVDEKAIMCDMESLWNGKILTISYRLEVDAYT
ncbi:hypothetical protein POPTR_001G280900v4 [Populus trichocarpa]|uniref:Uncharacterized protein n=1 Tax=Populus trichocarpa TaxID=3694 RepID=A0ACC0TLN8_POPTR|nr:hypothetical protein BDE02_01G252600 [Populus trichocarpa]KAI9402505.1 hypothetical protein POPTR_001G280900v4 [Populus trichocarpa]